MKVLLTFLAVFFLRSAAFSQTNCDNFKIGKFQNLEKGIVTTEIERSESVQIERYGEKEIKLKIEWLDNCSYRLTFLEGNEAWWDLVGRERTLDDLIVRITDINENSYLQESKFINDKEFKYRSSIQKVE